jgi:membrane-bound lytic murein transglycosylase F
MFLLALSFGVGLFSITSVKSSSALSSTEQNNVEIQIPLRDTEDDPDAVRVLLLFHAADYFVYKGVPIGFQYEMLRGLEKALGRNVEIKIENNPKQMLNELYRNCYDLIVMDDTPNRFIFPFLERSIPHSNSYPVLVTGDKADTAEIKPILVSADFPAKLQFDKKSHFVNYPIKRSQEHSTEELFEMADNGEIPYLICDYYQAITLIPFYSNVQILANAGPQFERRWIFNKKNVQLNDQINRWLLDFKKTRKYGWLLKKYFSQESSLINASFAKNQNNNISQYDDIIRKYAQQYDFDWRFVASIICQETKFISGLTGNGGSYGLMQLMPVTMDYYGISEGDGEEAGIRVGIQHLNSLRNAFDDIENEDEKLYFVAAAYNAGRGHIFDARRLCAKYEEDYKKWKDVSKYLKLKSQREYATDPLVKSGYFPGAQAVKYAQHVMERYDGYKAAYP